MNDDYRAILKAELEAQLDDVLSRWHWWSQGPKLVKGFSDGGSVTGAYRASRQYDDVNGALDDALENARMRQVDFQISEIGDPWRSALSALARSLCVGAAVFHSPRIAKGDRMRVTLEARAKLAIRLTSAGILC